MAGGTQACSVAGGGGGNRGMKDKGTQAGRCGRGWGDRGMQDKRTQAGSCGRGETEACRIRENRHEG